MILKQQSIINGLLSRKFYETLTHERFSAIGNFAKLHYKFSTFDYAVPQPWLNEIQEITKLERNEFIWVYPADHCFSLTYHGFIAYQKYLLLTNKLSLFFNDDGSYIISDPWLFDFENELIEKLIRGTITYDEYITSALSFDEECELLVNTIRG